MSGVGPKILFISWAPHCSRSDNIARELGGVSRMVYAGWLGSTAWTVWLKYLIQFVETLRVLGRERPDAVFVMTPPVLAGIPVWLYCRWRNIPFVIDAHTAAFLHPRWRRLQSLQFELCRRAVTTTVTNEHLAGMIRAAGADAMIVRDVPVRFDRTAPHFDRAGRFTVAVVCSFNYDEPIAEILTAAAALPDVAFLMTGDVRCLDPALAAALPPNVTPTGFLSAADYGGLLQSADVVLTLTTRDHTMLRGAYEAVYQGTPVIVSDWPVLRQAFARGAVHVDNSAAAISGAVRTIRENVARYRTEVERLRLDKLDEWDGRRRVLLSRIKAQG
jgi:glycosyltransferase involved in cell wall biosynthesis